MSGALLDSGASARPSVVRTVRRARSAVARVRALESLWIGIGAGLATAGLVVWDNGPTGRGSLFAAGALAGAFAALSWWLDARPRPERIARRIDRRLRLGGELFTAFEHEPRGGPLTPLLVRRVAARVPARDALRAALPRSMPLLAAPFLGAALLAAALDARSAATPANDWLAPGLAELAARMGEVELEAFEAARTGELDESDLGVLVEMRRRVRDLERERAAGTRDDERLEHTLAEAAGELERLADRLEREGADPELVRGLAGVGALADGAALRLSDRAAPPGPLAGEEAASEGSAGPPDAEGTPAADRDGDAGDVADPSEVDADADADRERALGVATAVGWPGRHRALVERWIEARRAHLAETAE